jgi:hypothetical protein
MYEIFRDSLNNHIHLVMEYIEGSELLEETSFQYATYTEQ